MEEVGKDFRDQHVGALPQFELPDQSPKIVTRIPTRDCPVAVGIDAALSIGELFDTNLLDRCDKGHRSLTFWYN